MIKRLLVLTFLLAGGTGTLPKAAAQEKSPAFPSATATSASKLSFRIIEAADRSFGYDIYSDGRLFIHQPAVPGMSGHQGFSNKAGAESVARLVIAKIARGEMPPTVTREEMERLHAL